ncbi:MAG TPA: PPA1309 family protein [Mycobacteriales bacterium]|nr:PPA1309 family protein [Mycobacteriales bacterium]
MDDLTLTNVVVEIEQHVAVSGWDQPPRLYALVDTGELLEREPQLSSTLGVSPTGPLTPVEQEALPDGVLDDVLAGLAWPDDVAGCALVNEVTMLPAELAAAMPSDVDEDSWAAGHPGRREIRLAVAVLRDGTRAGCLRLRNAEGAADDEVLVGADLVPNLADALLATLQ